MAYPIKSKATFRTRKGVTTIRATGKAAEILFRAFVAERRDARRGNEKPAGELAEESMGNPGVTNPPKK